MPTYLDTTPSWEFIVNADNGYSEVVWIKDAHRLVDAESYERSYTSADGRPPAVGYYVARWPAGTADPHFLDGKLRFDGPYPSRQSAEVALERGCSSLMEG